jgi:hypothetical protein
MLNFTPFIVKENNVFYFDAEEYNSKSDISVEESDLIKFKYEDKKYFAKVVCVNGKKNDFLKLEILKEE